MTMLKIKPCNKRCFPSLLLSHLPLPATIFLRALHDRDLDNWMVTVMANLAVFVLVVAVPTLTMGMMVLVQREKYLCFFPHEKYHTKNA